MISDVVAERGTGAFTSNRLGTQPPASTMREFFKLPMLQVKESFFLCPLHQGSIPHILLLLQAVRALGSLFLLALSTLKAEDKQRTLVM